MERSRLADAAFDALLVSLTVGGVLSPPDPLTQLLYTVPAFLVAAPAMYRYGQRTVEPWWRRYLLFVGGVFAVALVGRLVVLAVGIPNRSGLRSASLLAGILLGAWVAFFGGWTTLRSRWS